MKRLILVYAALISLLPSLAGCGDSEPDYESCSVISGERYCCRTYCNADGSKCTTECD